MGYGTCALRHPGLLMQRKGVVQIMNEIKLLRLLANGPKYLAEIEHAESCSQISALSAAIRLRKQRLIEFSYLKNSPLYLTAVGKNFLRRIS
jgi:predicted transcriptional regulator